MTSKKYLILNKLANYRRNLIKEVMKRAKNNYIEKIYVNHCKI